MRLFLVVLVMVLLLLSYDTMALGGRWQHGLVASASHYGTAARHETRDVFRRRGL
ncbi:hypothetical protein GJ689_12190 [Rhodoplanes serenus]|jgi:hypothetical protein|uniref:Uncharacterized protein n=1 Tax=Rhodoplanes serenus TaxID=200615 RepID=A0A447CVB1_9BRAD|nr:hypothetical protein [Rhodoplanes serenus]MBI5110527.1 hypothetical protein [Rhodovulum sp.]MTW16964.1 hypothetical protein [Rhodoplanes serenus]VCU09211.1 hypothetical protein RHODGE_RHODGE_02384 [Rhodoplanes serenus]